jgi:flavin-dependent dehydrogenase
MANVTTQSENYDVLIAGGGPAGSTAASYLARRGYKVLLVEREHFPRDHVGESMLPFSHKLFKDLGVLDQLKHTYVRKPGVKFIDRDGKGTTTWCFNHVISDETYLSFQVNRASFDKILLDNARRLGAEVREGTKATAFDISDPSSVTMTTVDESGTERIHRARFLIDATGRDAAVAAKNGWRKVRDELDRTAIWSHWEGVELQGGLEEGLSLIIYIGEEKKGWIWIFPLGPKRVTAGVVMQNSYVRDRSHALREAGSKEWLQELMMQELHCSPFAKKVLDGTEQVLPAIVNGNYSYEVQNHFGPNYAMIGDARGFIDPIFSSGVFLAINTARMVTDALHEKLSNNHAGVNDQMVAAYKTVTGAYSFVHRMIRLFYSPHSVTWAQVGATHAAHVAAESAMAAGHFMLSGDFFENNERYDKVFQLLESPHMFEHYVNLVLKRPDFQEITCHTKWETAFSAFIEGMEKP